MHILFTDTHPRKVAEATRTPDLQPALNDVIRILQITAGMFEGGAPVPMKFDTPHDDSHHQLAEYCSLSSSNWRYLSDIASMLLFEISVRIDWRRKNTVNQPIMSGSATFDDYKKAVVWSGVDVPINLPENGFFDVPFVLHQFYTTIDRNPQDAYRYAYADKPLSDDDLDLRSVPHWFPLTLNGLINYRRHEIMRYENPQKTKPVGS